MLLYDSDELPAQLNAIKVGFVSRVSWSKRGGSIIVDQVYVSTEWVSLSHRAVVVAYI